MKKLLILTSILLLVTSCQKENADVIIINSNSYTVNSSFDKTEAFAIKNGKFIAIGTTKEIQDKYQSTEIIDAKNQTIVPGLIDAHCHFYGLGLQQQKVDLRGTKSYNEVLQKLVAFQKKKNTSFITGRGWDQNDWDVKEFPTKEKLDELFPTIPVAVRRVDGHALLVNEAALKYSGFSSSDFPKNVSGGEFHQKNGKLTGILIDAAMGFIKIPSASKKEAIQGLLDAEKIAISYGLTTVDDAGLDRKTIELIDSLQQAGNLKMRIYAMISGNKQAQIDYYIKKGIYKIPDGC